MAVAADGAAATWALAVAAGTAAAAALAAAGGLATRLMLAFSTSDCVFADADAAAPLAGFGQNGQNGAIG